MTVLRMDRANNFEWNEALRGQRVALVLGGGQ